MVITLKIYVGVRRMKTINIQLTLEEIDFLEKSLGVLPDVLFKNKVAQMTLNKLKEQKELQR